MPRTIVIEPEKLCRTLNQLANAHTKDGMFQPAQWIAVVAKLLELPLDDAALSRSGAGRAFRAQLDFGKNGLSETFASLQNNSESNTGIKLLESVMVCKDAKVQQEPEIQENQDIPCLDLPRKVEETLIEQCGIDPELVINMWHPEDPSKRKTNRQRILTTLTNLSYRIAQGWVEKPSAYFRRMVERGFPVTRDSPEEIACKKAQKVQQTLLNNNDGVKIEQQKAEGLQASHNEPLASGVERIAPDIRQRIVKRLNAGDALDGLHVTLLQMAGITLKDPKKYNQDDAFTVYAAFRV